MAITFTTGTINEIDAANVGLKMAERIRDDVVAHPAWDLVEEFTASGGTARWYVFKCPATQSGFADDFYVIMGRNLGTGNLKIWAAEGYNSTTKVVSFYPPNASGPTVTYDSTGRSPDVYTLSTTQVGNSVGMPMSSDWTPSGTSTKWWITVDIDGFTVAFNGASNGFVHVGGYTPLTASSIPTPVCLWHHQSSPYGITRNPAIASATVTRYALMLFASQPVLGFQGTLQYNDKLQANQRPVAELGLQMTQNNGGASDAALFGSFLGKHKRVRIGTGVPAGFTFGDAYVLDGRLWVPYLPGDARMWDTGVSS